MRSISGQLLLCTFQFVVFFNTNALAVTYELRGVGTLPAIVSPPAGVPGENISVSVMLDSEDFEYSAVDNEIFHYFLPTASIPVQIVGSTSGEYPDVSPINRFVALELENRSNPGDQISLDVASVSSGTSLVTLFTDGVSGFDGDVTPYNSAQLFTLFEEALQNDGLWQRSSSSAVLVGSGENLLFLGEIEWTIANISRAGDFDSDGVVDGRDFLSWQRNPDIGDLADWQANYGTGTLPPTAVPEPCGFNFLPWGMVLLSSTRRRLSAYN